MIKDDKIFLHHIFDCINYIQEYTNKMTESDFLQNKLIQDATIRNFEIIGEATKQISKNLRDIYPKIDWKKMAGMRDKLIHDYIGVDLYAVWAVVKDILPVLKSEIESIIEKLENNS